MSFNALTGSVPSTITGLQSLSYVEDVRRLLGVRKHLLALTGVFLLTGVLLCCAVLGQAAIVGK